MPASDRGAGARAEGAVRVDLPEAVVQRAHRHYLHHAGYPGSASAMREAILLAIEHHATDLTAFAAAPAGGGMADGWRSMDDAPRDGEHLDLLVRFDAIPEKPGRIYRWADARWNGTDWSDREGHTTDSYVAEVVFLGWMRVSLAASTARPAEAGAAELADLREEVGYWRRDAAARMWSAKTLMQARRKEASDDLAFAHREALRAAVGASEEVQAKRWHTACELCGKPMLPGEETYYFADEGVSAHDRCAVEGAKDDTGAPDPTDADWIARTVEGRAALVADNEDDAPRQAAPASGVDLGGIEADLAAIERQVEITGQLDREETISKRTLPLPTTVEISLSHVIDAVKRIRGRIAELRRAAGAGDGVPDELRRLSEAATPGPWVAESNGGRGAWISGRNKLWTALSCGETDHSAEANAALISAAVNDLRSRIEAQDRARGAEGGEASE